MTTTIRRRTFLAAATASALALAIIPFTVTHAGSLARVDIYDRSAGEALPVYRHHGHKYVAGQAGNEYAVRVRNCSGVRLLAVVSVDGVNVISGETAAPDQSGYVIEPGEYVNIEGWRKDMDRTAAFYFTDPGDSYATRTGRPEDLGVIGVALFREPPHIARQWPTLYDAGQSSRAPAPAAQADASNEARAKSAGRAESAATMAQEPSLGTGHGRGEHSPVQRVDFERASDQPDEVVAIRYESRETLVALGVLPTPPRWWSPRNPNAFPGAMSFVPDP